MHRIKRLFDSLPHLRVGSSPEVLKHLVNPEVIAVAWQNAWPKDQIEHARQFAALPENNVEGKEAVELKLHTKADQLFTAEFAASYFRIKDAFCNASDNPDLTGFRDLSRVEPAFSDDLTREAEQFHQDLGSLVGFSNLGSATTEILISRPAGRLLDGMLVTEGQAPASRLIRKLLPGTFLAFKGANHPHLAGREMDGLFHRRQAPLKAERTASGRVVMHLKIG